MYAHKNIEHSPVHTHIPFTIPKMRDLSFILIYFFWKILFPDMYGEADDIAAADIRKERDADWHLTYRTYMAKRYNNALFTA